MNKELIEKLKHNEKPFGLLSQEEQECFEEVGIDNCEVYSIQGCQRASWNDTKFYIKFMSTLAPRIKADYNPEPEYTTLIIEVKDGILGVEWSSLQFIALHEILDMPNFRGFFAKDVKLSTTYHITPEGVARSIKDHKVFVRFEK